VAPRRLMINISVTIKIIMYSVERAINVCVIVLTSGTGYIRKDDSTYFSVAPLWRTEAQDVQSVG